MSQQQKVLFPQDDRTAAQRLEFECRAVQLRFTGISRSRRLSDQHKQEVADLLEADAKSLSLSKVLLDAKEPAIAKVYATKGAINAFWKGRTLPYPEAGLRLIREPAIPEFSQQIDILIAAHLDAVKELQEAMPGIKERQKERLGKAYSEDDYPTDVTKLFGATYEFKNTSPPEYLRKLKPELFEREMAKVRARFEAAAQLAEASVAENLLSVLDNLVGAVAQTEMGAKKVFRDTTANRLFDVFDDFQQQLAHFGIGQNGALHKAIEEAQAVVQGHDRSTLPGSLRKSTDFREQVAEKLAQVHETLQQSVVSQPLLRRSLLRSSDPIEVEVDSTTSS